MKHSGFSLNFQVGGGFFKVDFSQGLKDLYPPLGVYVSMLPGRKLEMEMPENAF